MPLYLFFIISALSRAGCAADWGGDWSTPLVQTHKPAPGVVQTVENSRRNFKKQNTRLIESQVKVRLDTPASSGDYTLTRKQVYEKDSLSTFNRKMQAVIKGENTLFIAEQSQLGKNSRGDFKGTFLRSYIFGGSAADPAVRLMLHFDPYLLVKRYTARLSMRGPKSEWLELASARGDSLEAAVGLLRGKIASLPAAKRRPAADFIMSLWSGALAYGNPMEMSQFLAPLLSSQGDRYLGSQTVEPIMDRARQALESLDSRRAQSDEWSELSQKLSKARTSLDEALRESLKDKKPGSQLAKQAQRYVAAVKPLLEASEGPPPSPVQGLQASAFWISKAYADFALHPPGSPEYKQTLESLPKNWSEVLSQQRSEVFLRALYLLLIAREARALQELARGAKESPDPDTGVALLKVRDELEVRAGAMRTRLAMNEPAAAERFFAWLEAPLGFLTSPAWAADPQDPFDDLLLRQEALSAFPLSFAELTPMEIDTALAEKSGAWPQSMPRGNPAPAGKRMDGDPSCP